MQTTIRTQDGLAAGWPPRARWIFLALALVMGLAGTISRLDSRLDLLFRAGAAGIGAAFLFFQPRLTFLLWALIVPTQYFLTDELGILPGPFRFADEALLLLLLLRVVGDRLRTGAGFHRTPWDLPLLGFLAIGTASALVNGVPAVNALAGLRAPIFMALVLYIVANAPDLFDRKYLMGIFGALLLLGGLQIVTAPFQYAARGFWADSFTGTMGPSGANDLGVYLLPLLFYLLSLRFDGRNRSVAVAAGILSMIVASVLCGSRAAWFIWLAAGLLLWGRRLLKGRVLVPAALGLAGVYVFTDWILTRQGVKSIGAAVGWTGVMGSLLLVSSGGGNLAYYPVVWRLVTGDAPVPLLGLGPGMVSSTAAVQLDAPLFRNVLYDKFGQTRFGLDGSVESQVLATGGETGPFGFLVLLSAVVIWLVYALRAHKRGASPEERALGAGVAAAALGAMALTPIRNVWEIQHLAFSLWFPGTILYALRNQAGNEPETKRQTRQPG